MVQKGTSKGWEHYLFFSLFSGPWLPGAPNGPKKGSGGASWMIFDGFWDDLGAIINEFSMIFGLIWD